MYLGGLFSLVELETQGVQESLVTDKLWLLIALVGRRKSSDLCLDKVVIRPVECYINDISKFLP